MSNMSYCRFENTANDLRDCEEALEEMINDPSACGPVNRYEMDAAPRLFSSAAAILQMLADTLGATITLTNADGQDLELDRFDWEEAFKKVQQDVTEAQGDEDEEEEA